MRLRDTSQIQIAVLKRAKELGIDLATAPEALFRRVALEVRSGPELVRDGWARHQAHQRVNRGIAVPPEVNEQNTKICQTNKCGEYLAHIDGCLLCQCVNNDLATKRKDIRQHCPKVNPETRDFYWDNRYVRLTKGETSAPSNSSN